MPPTFELHDGTTTLDLLSSPYHASQPVHLEPSPARPVLAGQTLRAVHYSPRTVESVLNLRASGTAGLLDAVRQLESMCATSEHRLSVGHGTPITLRCQLGDDDGDNVEYRVLRCEVVLPPNLLQEPVLSRAHAAAGVRLRLLIEPFGKLAQVVPTAMTIRNEQHGTSVNYVDITDLPGTHGALLGLKVHDTAATWDGTARTWIAVRSGERRIDSLFFQGEAGSAVSDETPFASGVSTWEASTATDANASGAGANVARMKWSTNAYSYEVVSSYTRIGYLEISIAGSSIPSGLFRVLARVRVDGNPYSRPFVSDRYDAETVMAFSLGWEFGNRKHEPSEGDEVFLEETDRFQTIDIGEVVVPPMSLPDGYSSPNLKLRVYGIFQPPAPFTDTVVNRYYFAQWDVDFLMLLPIDEGVVAVNSVSSDNRILMDAVSDTPGVYLLDSNDGVKRSANFVGGPFRLGVEDARIYVVRDDPSDPSDVQFTLTPIYTPLVAGI